MIQPDGREPQNKVWGKGRVPMPPPVNTPYVAMFINLKVL